MLSFQTVFILVSILLVCRAAFSRDPVWKRIGAITLVAFQMLQPVLLPLVPNHHEIYSFVRLGSWNVSALYLFTWGIWSVDRREWKVISKILGFAALVPILFTVVVGFLMFS